MTGMLAYIPFVEPIVGLVEFWYLLIIPLALGISIIYKALRVTDFAEYWRGVVVMTIQILAGMVGFALALLLLVQVVIPWLPAR